MIVMRKGSRLSELAHNAGVSPSTVSRVLNGHPSVSNGMYERVKEAAELLGIDVPRPGDVQKGLRPRVAILIPDGQNPFFSTLVQGVEDVCRRHHYDLVYFSSANRADREQEALDVIAQHDFPAAIIVPHSDDPARVRKLLDERRAIVFADRRLNGVEVPTVATDNEQGAYCATRYLLDLGHRNILYVGGRQDQSTERSRFTGFGRALEESGYDLDPAMVLEGSFEADTAYGLVRDAIKSGKRFTAISSADDMIAFGALNALKDANLAVPADVSIIGYDDIPFAQYASLTTVRQPAAEIGRNAMMLLLDSLSGRLQEPQEVLLDASLVIRSSCSRPRT